VGRCRSTTTRRPTEHRDRVRVHLAAGGFRRPAEQSDYVKQRFTETVDSGVAATRALAPGVEVTGVVVLGEPAPTLLDAAAGDS
jgi:hypothetical protein